MSIVMTESLQYNKPNITIHEIEEVNYVTESARIIS